MNILPRIALLPLSGLAWLYYHTLFALAAALSRREAAQRAGGSFWLDRPEDMDGDFRKARSQY